MEKKNTIRKEGALAPSFHINKSDQSWVDEYIESVFRNWIHNWRDEYKDFKAAMEVERDRYDYRGSFTNLAYMSKEKDREIVGFVPKGLNLIMTSVFGDDWNFNQFVSNRFWYKFDLGRLRKEKPGRPGPGEKRIVRYES